MPSGVTQPSICTSSAASPTRRAVAMAMAAPTPASASPSVSVPQGDARRTHRSPCPRSTRTRASITGSCHATVARSSALLSASAAGLVSTGVPFAVAVATSGGASRPPAIPIAVAMRVSPSPSFVSAHHAARSAASRGSPARRARTSPRSASAATSATSTPSSCRASAVAVAMRVPESDAKSRGAISMVTARHPPRAWAVAVTSRTRAGASRAPSRDASGPRASPRPAAAASASAARGVCTAKVTRAPPAGTSPVAS